MEDKTASKLLATLRRLSPAKVRVYAGDDDSRDIAVPTRRRKWSQVIEAIEARSWTRAELLDKSNAVLGYVENVEPARDVEDLVPGSASKTRTDVEWMLNLIVRAQREAMTYRDAEVTNLLRAQGDVVREMVAAMHSLHAINEAKVNAAAEVAALQAQAAAGNGGMVSELLEAAPTLLQMLPAIKALVAGNPSNGVKKPAS